MNSLTIFFLIAVVLSTFVTVKSARIRRSEKFLDGRENRREFSYPDKYECKDDENCEELYGTERKLNCRFGLCEEDNESSEYPICRQAACELSCDVGYRCTCSRKRHCIQLDDAIYSPDIKNSHPRNSTTENSQQSRNHGVENNYYSYSTNDHPESVPISFVPHS